MMETKIPQTKQEAFARLDEMLSEEDKKAMMQAKDAIEFHFSIGLWIRNIWIYEQNEEDVNRLAKAFGTNERKGLQSFQPYLYA